MIVPVCGATRSWGVDVALAKALALSRLHLPSALPAQNVPLRSASARQANPLLISEASEYVQTVDRDDQPVIAGAPGNYYRDAGVGNRLAFGLTGMRTLNHSGQPSRTSPLGRQESVGQ